MPETAAPPAAAITEALSATRPKPAANTAHKRQISEAIPRNERLIARQARPEPAEGDAREDHQGGGEGSVESAVNNEEEIRAEASCYIELLAVRKPQLDHLPFNDVTLLILFNTHASPIHKTSLMELHEQGIDGLRLSLIGY
jgi:hypothetical protein